MTAERLLLTIPGFGETLNCIIEVHDTGPGIPPEIMVHIFDPFFTTKPTGSGVGLGLSISHELVAAHGGRLTVESVLGQGSVFRVQLPTCAPPVHAPVPAPEAPTAQRRLRLLIVDDEPTLTTALRQILQPQHDVVVAEKAEAALAHFDAGERFDVVLCDLMLPGMRSFELCDFARAIPTRPSGRSSPPAEPLRPKHRPF